MPSLVLNRSLALHFKLKVKLLLLASQLLLGFQGFCLLLLLKLGVLDNYQTLTNLNGQIDVELVVLSGLQDHRPYVLNPCKQAQRWHEPHQLVILRVIVPREDRYTVLRLELVAVRGVVDNDDILHPAANPLHVLDKLPIEKGAVLSEQPLRRHFVLV